MNTRVLLGLSLCITALTTLYLLFINLYRETFVASDWIVVGFDLFAKVVIESIVLFKRR